VSRRREMPPNERFPASLAVGSLSAHGAPVGGEPARVRQGGGLVAAERRVRARSGT